MANEATTSGANHRFDIVVIGSGPAGQKAAVQAAKAGKSVLLIEKERGIGGACVHRGTIPSKTLRETAVYFAGFRKRTAGIIDASIPRDVQLGSLMSRMERVVAAHSQFMELQLNRNGITQWHGRAHFLDEHHIEVEFVLGQRETVRGDTIVIATGSRPRTPDEIPVDHEHILDSDSILSLMYVPRSLTVLGSGIVACEYASIFGSLDVEVTIIDKYPSPMGFIDPELTTRFIGEFERNDGCRFLGERCIQKVEWNMIDAVETHLDNGDVIRSEKMLCALGRVANLDGMQIERAGLKINARGLLDVTEHCQTRIPHIYAVGDVIGPPALASSSMEQGRRAVCHALGMPVTEQAQMIPTGIYTIPEMSCVGLTEAQARERYGECVVGRAQFSELARGQIACCTDGMLKLVIDADTETILGVQILGDGATELIHVGQMALMAGFGFRVFIESIFNFPTLAEAYRVAALDAARHLAAQRDTISAT